MTPPPHYMAMPPHCRLALGSWMKLWPERVLGGSSPVHAIFRHSITVCGRASRRGRISIQGAGKHAVWQALNHGLAGRKGGMPGGEERISVHASGMHAVCGGAIKVRRLSSQPHPMPRNDPARAPSCPRRCAPQ